MENAYLKKLKIIMYFRKCGEIMKIESCIKNNEQWKVALVGILSVFLVTACAPEKPAEQIPNGYLEEEVEFIFGDLTLYGVLTLPK